MSGIKKSSRVERLAPKTKRINVEITQLVPDPNNPRFTTSDQDSVPDNKVIDHAISGETFRRMYPDSKKDPFDIKSLCRSIKENGWQPVDAIFVRHIKGERGRYVVLEGNRRLTAITELLKDSDFRTTAVGQRLARIDVLEVVADKQSDDEVKRQITYLLGVRHHGSLKRWSAFAQAANIYSRYKELAKIEDADFSWDPNVGVDVASSLSIPVKTVHNRLRVYIAMRQLSAVPEVADGPGGVQDRHYSLVEEGLKPKELNDYLKQDDKTFLLSDDAVNRFVQLCHFDRAGREGSPMTDPREWRPLAKIVSDQDQDKSGNNLRLVTEQKKKPSEVWAARSVELRTPTWETWLQRLLGSLSTIPIAGPFNDEESVALIRELRSLLRQLQSSENQ
jgi:hypothetical protein